MWICWRKGKHPFKIPIMCSEQTHGPANDWLNSSYSNHQPQCQIRCLLIGAHHEPRIFKSRIPQHIFIQHEIILGPMVQLRHLEDMIVMCTAGPACQEISDHMLVITYNQCTQQITIFPTIVVGCIFRTWLETKWEKCTIYEPNTVRELVLCKYSLCNVWSLVRIWPLNDLILQVSYGQNSTIAIVSDCSTSQQEYMLHIMLWAATTFSTQKLQQNH